MSHPYTEALRKSLADRLEGYGKKAKVAADAGIAREQLSAFVNGDTGITMDIAGRIADALGVDLAELLRLPKNSRKRAS